MSKKTNENIKAVLVQQENQINEIPLAKTLELQKLEIERALPSRMDADRFARIVLTTVKASPGLLECTKTSIIAGCMLAAQLGLEPGPLGHSYLVPFWNKNIKAKEAQFMIGYKGAIDLAWRSGRLRDIQARTVYEGDTFEEEYGTNERLRHIPKRSGARGRPQLFYLIARFVGGGHHTRVAEPYEIEEHRARSKAAEAGPWQTDYEPMAWKTLVHMSKPWLQLSPEAAAGLVLDGAVVDTFSPNMVDEVAAERDVIDVEATETNAEQSEAAVAEDAPQYDENDPGRPFE